MELTFGPQVVHQDGRNMLKAADVNKTGHGTALPTLSGRPLPGRTGPVRWGSDPRWRGLGDINSTNWMGL